MIIKGMRFISDDIRGGVWGEGIGADIEIAKTLYNKISYFYERTSLSGKKWSENQKYYDSTLSLPLDGLKDLSNIRPKYLPGLLEDMNKSGMFINGSYENKVISFELNSNDLERFDFIFVNLNTIVEGVAGSGKSYILKELRKSGVYGYREAYS